MECLRGISELQEIDRKTTKFINCNQEVMLHCCIFLGKMMEEDLFDMKTL